MKRLLQASAAVAFAFSIGTAFVHVPDASAQQRHFKGKGGGGPIVHSQRRGGHHHGGHRRGSRSGKIAGGIAAGIAGAIILNEVTRGDERRYRGGMSCRELDLRCGDGQDWACRRLDRDC